MTSRGSSVAGGVPVGGLRRRPVRPGEPGLRRRAGILRGTADRSRPRRGTTPATDPRRQPSLARRCRPGRHRVCSLWLRSGPGGRHDELGQRLQAPLSRLGCPLRRGPRRAPVSTLWVRVAPRRGHAPRPDAERTDRIDRAGRHHGVAVGCGGGRRVARGTVRRCGDGSVRHVAAAVRLDAQESGSRPRPRRGVDRDEERPGTAGRRSDAHVRPAGLAQKRLGTAGTGACPTGTGDRRSLRLPLCVRAGRRGVRAGRDRRTHRHRLRARPRRHCT